MADDLLNSPPGSSAAAVRSLRVGFETFECFRDEFGRSLANGGIFAETDEAFVLGEPVQVELVLAYSGSTTVLDGRVVQVVTAVVAAQGASGVAVQFQAPPERLRIQLRAWAQLAEPIAIPGYPKDRRQSPRTAIKFGLELEWQSRVFPVRSLNLSRSGVLVVAPELAIPIAEKLNVTLERPGDRSRVGVDATVVRHVETEEGISGFGLRFDLSEEVRGEVELLIDEIQAFEYVRRLGGIRGPIDEIGIANLVQMLASASAGGCLYLERGNEDGRLWLDRGVLQRCELGQVSGSKALERLLRWREGNFWFESQPKERDLSQTERTRLDGALLDALTRVDELERLDLAALRPSTKLDVNEQRLDERGFVDARESAILEHARSDRNVRSILNAMPDSDLEVYRVLLALLQAKILEPCE